MPSDCHTSIQADAITFPPDAGQKIEAAIAKAKRETARVAGCRPEHVRIEIDLEDEIR